MSEEKKLSEEQLVNASGGGNEIEIFADSNDIMVTCEIYNRGACPYNFSTYQGCVTVQLIPGCSCKWRRN